MFTHVPHEFAKLSRTNDDGVRKYLTPTGEKYPSVTTVLSSYGAEGIAKWRARVGEAEANKISTRAANRGTSLHSALESYLHNNLMEDMNLLPTTKKLFLQIRPLIERINNIHCLETSLFSHNLKLAGTVDCVAEFDGVLTVIDFKTSSRLKKKEQIENYFMQATAYALMFEEMTGIHVPQVAILIAVESANFPQLMKDKPETYIDRLNHYIKLYEDR